MIVITTPTGLIGHQVLHNVLDSDEPIRVIARDPSRLPAHIHKRVEVVQGSLGDIDVVTRAFAGADSVFWLVPPDPHAERVEAAYVDFTKPACEAFKSQQPRRKPPANFDACQCNVCRERRVRCRKDSGGGRHSSSGGLYG